MVSVVDIFAGPGGLSEGFASLIDDRGRPAFDVVLSVEKDGYATKTLRLRTFFRQFGPGQAPESYYRRLRGEISTEELYEMHPSQAGEALRRCWHAELGAEPVPARMIHDRISQAIRRQANWVLIGGPPCQAYSIAGRSRNQAKPGYDPDSDVRQRLYIEYLDILGNHWPAAFVMENVKGLLSATLEDERIFHQIIEDLRDPTTALIREGRADRRGRAHRYRIFSLVEQRMFENGDLQGAVIQAERYGVPQARHRVILLGLRDDLHGVLPQVLRVQREVPLSSALEGLPPVRSGLSRRTDSADNWTNCLRSQVNSRWATSGTRRVDGDELSTLLRATLATLEPPAHDRGSEFVAGVAPPRFQRQWFHDPRIGGVCNHSTRAHMDKDLFRYIYAACYAQIHGRSPGLRHFPQDLLPDHLSVDIALTEGGNFSDRFRVQVAHRPSTTIMSHIHKDGHYYIHPDPKQCRSLTVREAPRLQTFPDKCFLGMRPTAQFIHVRNAVLPLPHRQHSWRAA